MKKNNNFMKQFYRSESEFQKNNKTLNKIINYYMQLEEYHHLPLLLYLMCS